jgi:hypothetical protein
MSFLRADSSRQNTAINQDTVPSLSNTQLSSILIQLLLPAKRESFAPWNDGRTHQRPFLSGSATCNGSLFVSHLMVPLGTPELGGICGFKAAGGRVRALDILDESFCSPYHENIERTMD